MQRKSEETRPFLRFLVVALIVLMAGPEIVLALEIVAVIDVVGIELFLFCVSAGFLWHLKSSLRILGAVLERLDPFFFIPTRAQVRECPGILVHAIPGLVGACLIGYIAADNYGDWVT
jgi:hypothetical protein